MSTLTPIKPDEIREGDRVRVVYSEPVAGIAAVEYIAASDGRTDARPNEHLFRITPDRPTAPTSPTPGWITTTSGDRRGGVFLADRRGDWAPADTEGHGQTVADVVTSFTEAVLVPKDALVGLREAWANPKLTHAELVVAASKFLAETTR